MSTKTQNKKIDAIEKTIEDILNDYKNDKITLQEAKVRLKEIPSLYMEALTQSFDNDPLWKEAAPKLFAKLFNF